MTYFSKKKLRVEVRIKTTQFAAVIIYFIISYTQSLFKQKKVLKRNDQRRNMDITKYTLYKF